jgi:hypothetical protein
MGGGMMDGSIRDMGTDVEHLVAELGRLPEAPLAMPKQRLEAPDHGIFGLLARFARRSALPVGDARRSGH